MDKEKHNESCRKYYVTHSKDIITKKMQKYYQFKEKWYGNKFCEMCGSTVNLHYHHLDPSTKSFGITKRWNYNDDAMIQKEIDKCILVCGNCHRVIHEMGIPEEYLCGNSANCRNG